MKKLLLIFGIALCISACSGVNTGKVITSTDSISTDSISVDSIDSVADSILIDTISID